MCLVGCCKRVTFHEIDDDDVELLSLVKDSVGVVDFESAVGVEDVEDDEQPSLENGNYLDVPDVNVPTSWGRFGDFYLVGHGEVTNSYCGAYISKKLMGCLNVGGHNVTRLDGRNFAGKVYVQKAKNHCGKPDCPVCYKDGWAVREAFRARDRLESVSGHGLIEHIILSVPVSDYGLSLKDSRKKAVALLAKLGVSGGCLVFHAFRYDKSKGWWYSPHWHVVGFVEGGFKCRSCPSRYDCRVGCDGFNAKRWVLFQDTGYYCKVMGKRENVGGTLWYQLNHASYYKPEGKKRSSIITWFGICSYRKLQFTAEVRKRFCPICGDVLVRIQYLGKLAIGQLEGEGKNGKDLYLDYRDDDGNVLWRVAPSRSKGGSGIAGAKLLKDSDYADFSKEACDKWQSYLDAERKREEDEERSAFYKTCALCHQSIVDVSVMRMMDGVGVVHRHCIPSCADD